MTSLKQKYNIIVSSGLVLLLLSAGLLPAAPDLPERSGSERTAYRDAKTGRIIWRMTESEMNDKHGYYDWQSWNPEMTKIVWSSGKPDGNRGAIYLMDADGSNIRKIVEDTPYGMHTGCKQRWSRDGKYIEYGDRVGSTRVDLQGNPAPTTEEAKAFYKPGEVYRKGPVRITKEMCMELSPHQTKLGDEPGRLVNLKWSPDGETVIIGYTNEKGWIFPENGDPRWIPPTVKELYLMDADGTNFRRLGNYGHHHSWTPDSQSILFVAPNHKDIVLQAADGSSRRVVATIEGVAHPSLNPQGTQVVTDVTEGRHKDFIVLIDVETAEVERLAHTPRTRPRSHKGTHVHPTWSPDGSMVMYDSDETGVSQIYIVVVDEEKVRQRFGEGAIPYAGPAGGLVGPRGRGSVQGQPGPPKDPARWTKLGEVIGADQVWGSRVGAVGVFQVPEDSGDAFGLFYRSRPAYESAEDGRTGPLAVERSRQGLARGETGSIAFARDLRTWQDFPQNPVLEKLQPWQGGYRLHAQALVYDPSHEQWVCYFGDGGGEYPGIRAVSVARSEDLIDWTFADGPVLTVDDFAAAVPERIKASPEELRSAGRVYVNWVIYHNDRYYVCLKGSNRVGDERTYTSFLLAAEAPEGPYSLVEETRNFWIPDNAPAYWNGRWYASFVDHWGKKPGADIDPASVERLTVPGPLARRARKKEGWGVGLASAKQLTGPYEKCDRNPIFPIDTGQRVRPYLFQHEETWVIIYTRQPGEYWEPMTLHLAIASPDRQ